MRSTFQFMVAVLIFAIWTVQGRADDKVGQLVAGLKATEVKEALESAKSLAKLRRGALPAVKSLVNALSDTRHLKSLPPDDDPTVASHAFTALLELMPESVPHLLDAAKTGSPLLRERALHVLLCSAHEAAHSEKVREARVQIARKDSNAGVRREALIGLEHFIFHHTDEEFELLLTATRDESPFVRQAAARQLRPQTRKQAERIAERMREMLADHGKVQETSLLAGAFQTNWYDFSVPRKPPFPYEGKFHFLRASAATTLGRTGSKSDVRELLPLIKDPDKAVRIAALGAIIDVDPFGNVGRGLVYSWLHSDDLQFTALRLLHHRRLDKGWKAVRKKVIQFSRHSSRYVRREAAVALVSLGAEGIRAALPILKDPMVERRNIVYAFLGRVRTYENPYDSKYKRIPMPEDIRMVLPEIREALEQLLKSNPRGFRSQRGAKRVVSVIEQLEKEE